MPKLQRTIAENEGAMHVYVDENICQGHTLCNMVAPEIFHLSEIDGHAFVVVTELTADQQELALKAASTCPERAIVVTQS
jgi:ferredoxin